jgi:cysteine desulfurase
MEKSKKIYLDHASATPIDKRVITVMNMIFKKYFTNPSAIHALGASTAKILEDSRKYVARVLDARPSEIVFTGGATENNNLAILGVLKKCYQIFYPRGSRPVLGEGRSGKKFDNIFLVPHIVTTNIEHPSVMEVCKHLEDTKQAEITYVKIEKNGIIDPEKIKKALRPNTVLVSVMYANNEIGTIQPIKEIAKEIRHYKKHNKNSPIFPIFYTDATQAINYLPVNVLKLGVDMLSFNGDKIYGPKDVGVLYVKKNVPLSNIMFGGNQESGLRPGTENVASIVGLAEALKITEKEKEKEKRRLLKLRDYFIKKLLNLSSEIKINGDLKNRLPNNINITIPKIPSDLLVIELSARGIFVSEKSACKSNDKKGSYVIEALGFKQNGSLRFSLGRETTKADIDYTIKSLSKILKKLKKWYN